jgi:hypothetical protein
MVLVKICGSSSPPAPLVDQVTDTGELLADEPSNRCECSAGVELCPPRSPSRRRGPHFVTPLGGTLSGVRAQQSSLGTGYA